VVKGKNEMEKDGGEQLIDEFNNVGLNEKQGFVNNEEPEV
jgi:hypothetical protein